MRVHHLAIQVQDVERALTFYRDLLGLPETRRQPHSVWLDAGGVILMLERCAGDPRPAPWRSEHPGLHLLALAIDPAARADTRRRLLAAGYPIEGESAFTLYTRDPEGNRVGLSHYPDPAREPSPQ